MEPEQAAEALGVYRRHTDLLFSLEHIDSIVRMGRIPPEKAQGVGVLGVRLLGRAEQGSPKLLGRIRGERRNRDALLSEMEFLGYRGGKVIIEYQEDDARASDLMRAIRSRFGTAEIRVQPCSGLCDAYVERGGLLVALER